MSDAPKSPEMQALVVINKAIVERKETFAATLPKSFDVDRFQMVVWTHVRKNPELWKCTKESIIGGAMTAAEMQLDFSVRNEVSLVPLRNKKTGLTEAQPWIGYKGAAKLARRSPTIIGLTYDVVREKDFYEAQSGSKPCVIHRYPGFGERGAIIGAYASAETPAHTHLVEQMTVDELEDHARRYIRAGNYGPFAGVKANGRKDSNFEAYALKTILLRFCNRKLDLSPQQSKLLQQQMETFEEQPKEVTPGADELNRVLGVGKEETVIEPDWEEIGKEVEARLQEDLDNQE